MVLNSKEEKQVMKNLTHGKVFVRSETGLFSVWAQTDWQSGFYLRATIGSTVITNFGP